MKIGVLDSGAGGLLTAKKFHEQGFSVAYMADTLHFPYGNQPIDVIRNRAIAMGRWLYQTQNCTHLVIACHTISSCVQAEEWKEALHLQNDALVLNVIDPMVDALSMQHAQSKVLILATQRTIDTRIYLLKAIEKKIHIDRWMFRPVPRWAPWVESYQHACLWVQKGVEEDLSNITFPIDVVVLGCTHYHFLKPWIMGYFDRMHSKPSIIDITDVISFEHAFPSAHLHQSPRKHTDPDIFCTQIQDGLAQHVKAMWHSSTELKRITI